MRSTLIPIFKNKGDIQECGNYREIKLTSHTLKIWERVVEGRLREKVMVSNHAKEKYNGCNLCTATVTGKVSRKPEGTALCVHRPGKGL